MTVRPLLCTVLVAAGLLLPACADQQATTTDPTAPAVEATQPDPDVIEEADHDPAAPETGDYSQDTGEDGSPTD